MSRPVERIDIILDVLDIKQFLLDLKIPVKIADECDIAVIEDWKLFVKNWKSCPDERLTQTLVNQGFLPNIPGFWYYTEESDYCVDKGLLKPEEIYFWGSYGIKGDKPLKRRLLKDLSKSHMRAILKTQPQISDVYRETFKRLINENPKKQYERKSKKVPQKIKNSVNLQLELLKLKFKVIHLEDGSGYWFEKQIKGNNFNYRVIIEDDYPFILLQTEVFVCDALGDKRKEYEDIYRYIGKITIDKVKEVIKMVK